MHTTLAAAIALMVLMSISLLPAASAHPYIEKTIPDSSQNAPIGTTEIIVFFSEAVDIDFSEISVLNDKGERIDNRDVAYYQDDIALVVTTPPLESGAYTVSTNVLSKVDGHLVPWVFLFGAGDVALDPEQILDIEESTELIFLPEAAAKFLGSMGQTIIVGAVIAAFAVWGMLRKQYIKNDMQGRLEKIHHRMLVQLTGAGLLLVLSSIVATLVTQLIRLEASLGDVIQTQFGIIWLARLAVTAVLLAAWFAMNRSGAASSKTQAVMLGSALIMMLTYSISGHGAATEIAGAVALDYVHNVVAGIWVGGIIYMLFGFIPTLSGYPEGQRERVCLAAIPRFSMIFIISVGVVIVTGPTLLWMLESDTVLITESLFGRLIMLKIAIASVMVGLGALIQYRVQRRAERDLRASRRILAHAKLKSALRIDAALGVLLLVIVALLTNGTLPAGEIRSVDASEVSGLSLTEFSENARFEIEIIPFSTGENIITILASREDGAELEDLDRIKVKLSNPSAGIPPLEVIMEPVQKTSAPDGAVKFQGEVIFGFSGQWLVEIEAQRTESANEAVRLNLFAKPRLADINTNIIEYSLSNGSRPLHAAYDENTVWFSDAAAPRLWEITTDTKEITQYEFEGTGTMFLTYNHRDGNVWFTDSGGGQIGFMNTESGRITTIPVPEFGSERDVAEESIPFFIEADQDGSIWFTIINKGLIARYQPQAGTFEEIVVPGNDTRPFALEEGPNGMIWYTDTGTGVVGYVNPDDGSITEVLGRDEPLSSPEALLFESNAADGVKSLWISEHTGTAVIRFDPFLETLDRYMVPDEDALPFGMTVDRYGNLWFAEHTTDKIGVIDPSRGEVAEMSIPTQTSFVQFIVTDDSSNLWFAEQRASKIGMLEVTEGAGTYQAPGSDGTDTVPPEKIKYADLASPLIALGILATSLFYVKAVHDKKRLDRLLTSD